jgi:hypothetical protein
VSEIPEPPLYYPAQRPSFLFSPTEQQAAAVTSEQVNALILKRDALEQVSPGPVPKIRALRYNTVAAERSFNSETNVESEAPLSQRAETTYLHIIGALLKLLLGQSPSGLPYSSFKSQESIVDALVAHFGGELMGVTQRTLHAKFAAANRKLEGR